MRNTKIVTIKAAGRDQGRSYLLTEMAASRAERWAVRAFLALSRSGVAIPDNVVGSGMAGLALVGFQAMCRVDFPEAEHLLGEMMACVQKLPDLAEHPEIVRPLREDDIEEVATRFQIYGEVFHLHTGFFFQDALSKWTSEMKPGPSPSAAPTSQG